MITTYLGLTLTPSEEWETKKYRDFIEDLAGVQASSALNVIDENIGELKNILSELETQLSAI